VKQSNINPSVLTTEKLTKCFKILKRQKDNKKQHEGIKHPQAEVKSRLRHPHHHCC